MVACLLSQILHLQGAVGCGGDLLTDHSTLTPLYINIHTWPNVGLHTQTHSWRVRCHAFHLVPSIMHRHQSLPPANTAIAPPRSLSSHKNHPLL